MKEEVKFRTEKSRLMLFLFYYFPSCANLERTGPCLLMTDFPARKSNAHKYYSKLKVNKTRTCIRRDWDTLWTKNKKQYVDDLLIFYQLCFFSLYLNLFCTFSIFYVDLVFFHKKLSYSLTSSFIDVILPNFPIFFRPFLHVIPISSFF